MRAARRRCARSALLTPPWHLLYRATWGPASQPSPLIEVSSSHASQPFDSRALPFVVRVLRLRRKREPFGYLFHLPLAEPCPARQSKRADPEHANPHAR